MSRVIARRIVGQAGAPLTHSQEHDLGRLIEAGARTPGGTRESREATERLVLSHVRLVLRIAARYRHLGLPFEDLVSEGCIGLLIAAERFDPGRQTRFLSYASWWIRKAILRAISETSTVVRFPEYQRSLMMRRRAERMSRGPRTARRRDEPAAPRGITGLIVSLEDQPGEHGRPLLETLPLEGARDPEQEALRVERVGALRRAFHHLDARERFVISHRFGLTGTRSMTLQQIAGTLGISRERVRQIEKGACLKLRSRLGAARFFSGG